MTNVVQIRNSGGFTRMDNELYEALIGADLSGRELRVALAIHRQTVGYNVPESRIAASYIAEMANIHREDVSRIVSELLRQRILYRTGGSRSPMGIAPVREWKIDGKNTRKSTEAKAPQCGVFTTSIVALSPHNKDSKDNTNTDVLVNARNRRQPDASAETIPTSHNDLKSEESPPKPKRKPVPKTKAAFGLDNLLLDNPHGASEQVLSDWLQSRKAHRAPVTATVWKQFNAEFAKCAVYGITADHALTEAMSAGWRGFKCEWLMNRQSRFGSLGHGAQNFDLNDTSWAKGLHYDASGRLVDEDGL